MKNVVETRRRLPPATQDDGLPATGIDVDKGFRAKRL